MLPPGHQKPKALKKTKPTLPRVYSLRFFYPYLSVLNLIRSWAYFRDIARREGELTIRNAVRWNEADAVSLHLKVHLYLAVFRFLAGIVVPSN